MSKEKRRVPKLRFPGFTEDWEQCKLGDVVKSYSGGTPTASNKEYYGGDIPFIRSAEINSDTTELYITQEGLDNSSAKIVDKGTILYAMYGATSGEVGISKINGAINQAILAMIPLEYNSRIIAQYLRKNKESIIGKYLQGGQGNLSANIILELPIQLPGLEESNQIANFLESFDNIITLHQRKLDNLKLKKKALLQKLFPKNGERYPELRFPGFTDAWEQRKLSDISTKVTTKNVDVHYTETLTNSAEQGIISQVDFFDKEISNKDNINGYYIVENNDFIYNPRISTLAPVGPINRNKLNRTGIMSPLYTVFRASKVDLGFLEWYFQSNHWHRYMKLNGDSGARADRIAIKDSTFFDMPIKTPVNIKEQVLIGETLEKFNQYITLHQRKLDHLQLQKKALLQQMFV